jgi:hypothetical protein
MPSSPGYKRDYKQEAATESKDRKKKRAMRNKARRQMMREGKVKKGDGKDVDHKNGNARDGRRSNLRVVSAKTNRSYQRTKGAHKKNPKD